MISPVIILLHGAGSSSAMYSTWVTRLRSFATVVAPNFPRRAMNMQEDSASHIYDIVNLVAKEISRLDGCRPVIIFGHSMGAVVAFELARMLDVLGHSIKGLILAASRAPHDLNNCVMEWHLLPDEDLINRLKELGGTPDEVWQETELHQLILPVVRSDFKILSLYRPDAESIRSSLGVDVQILGGSDDPIVSHSNLQRWAEILDDNVDVSVFCGNHFFIFEHADKIIELIKRKITT